MRTSPLIAATLRIPMLILQGERDYQVTQADLEGWRTERPAKSYRNPRVHRHSVRRMRIGMREVGTPTAHARRSHWPSGRSGGSGGLHHPTRTRF